MVNNKGETKLNAKDWPEAHCEIFYFKLIKYLEENLPQEN